MKKIFTSFFALVFLFGCTGKRVTHCIGELYGGGIIVAVWDSVGIQHGLIASLKDISESARWASVPNYNSPLYIGLIAESYSDGQTNTNSIIQKYNNSYSTGTFAAYLCKQYNGGSFSDWYLPALWELNECYKAVEVVNRNLGDNGFQPFPYWSSSEKRQVAENARLFGDFAWSVDFGGSFYSLTNGHGAVFGGGNDYLCYKMESWHVRAIRRF